MSQEDYPVEFVLDSIEAVMAPSKQPKVLLFDIGGVCVVSPFKAILDYELSLGIPPGWVNHSISSTKPNGTWQKLERGEILLDHHFFTSFHTDLHNATLWPSFHKKHRPNTPIPPLPSLDVEWLYWEMMRESRAPDPWMWPALKKLRRSGKYILAALSNTVIFPPSHPYSTPAAGEDVRAFFDVFISSAHVGLRKPDPEIYSLALSEVDKWSREKGKGGVKADEVLFLDDIGENLKAGKAAGFGTIKVKLGRAYEAVDELERVTGLKLAGHAARVPAGPGEVFKGKGKAKL